MQRISIREVEGPALCFDTGLDSRSFAQAKFAKCFAEQGHIVFPDGSNEIWKVSGVIEDGGSMQMWGPPFRGERLELLVEATSPLLAAHNAAQSANMALQAVAYWIRAKMLLGQTHSVLNPGAAFIAGFGDVQITCGDSHPKGSVFFAPEMLSARCMLVEGAGPSRYICADLEGMEAIAFCAGAMLYRILTGDAPFSAGENLYQDMREGFFLPPHLACSGLDEKLSNLIQDALLLPAEKVPSYNTGTAILGELLEIIMGNWNEAAEVSSFFRQLSDEENAVLAKEKERFLKRKNITVKTKRFAARNKAILLGITAALIVIFFAARSVIKSRAELPTTKGMDPPTVVLSYYNAFGMLDHHLMEACLKGADKSDVNMVINLFVINRVRRAYDFSAPVFIPAGEWKEQGGELPAPNVFGVTDLSVEYLFGSEDQNLIQYRTVYTLWFPNEQESSRQGDRRSDELTLTRKRGKWQITEIKRVFH